MGFAVSFSFEPNPRPARAVRTGVLAAVAALAALALLFAGPALAQSPPAGGQSTEAKPQDKLIIDADELVYDKDKNIVTASGSVQLFYQGRVLQADRVIYDRNTKRVYAEGHAKMTDEHGDVMYGSRFELSDDFREGFIDSVQVLTSDKTRFTSPRVERSNGDITVLEKGGYTACEPCKDHPDWPPFWQVRATKIIENQETHTVYYEDAQLLFWGFPVFYMPYFSAPNSTVNKQTGLLAPSFVSGADLGYGISMPYFINLAPNYDLLLNPTYLSKQGLLGEVDWRQRLSNGIYSIRMTGIGEQQPLAFPEYPYGAGDQRLRGSIETKGNFLLNDMWQFGWNGTWMSDKFFLNDYRLQGIDFDNFYYQDVVSSVYLRGQSDQSYFDLSAYHFEGTTANDDNRTLPVAVAPVLDYNRVIDVPADRTNGLGGELTVDANVANIDQTNAAFQSTGLQTFDNAYHLYNVCQTPVGTTSVNTYFPGQCLLRGIAGDYTRASAQVSWQRSYINSIGEVWKPFVFARLDGEATELNETGSITYASSSGVSTVANSSQAAFFSGSDQGAFARGMAGVGVEYQYPFTSTSSWGTQTITPIAQFIVRPNEIIPKSSRMKIRKASSSTKRTCSPGTNSPATIASKAARGSITACNTQRISPTAATPILSAGSRSRSPGRIPIPSMIRRTRASNPASTRRSPTSSSARRCNRSRTRFRSSANSSSIARPGSSTVSTGSPRRASPGSTEASIMRSTPPNRRWDGSTRAKA